MKIAIVGGGASGLACAIECLRSAEKKGTDVRVTVYEKRERVGKKLLATGNGRCNMMNRNEGQGYFGSREFMGYALEKYDVRSNLDFFASMGLYTRTDSEGRVYPLSNQASSVLDALRFECERLGAEICCEREITSVKRKGSSFLLNGSIEADRVVLSCGGKAAVKGFNGYDILKNLGHRVVTPLPSLSRLTVRENQITKQLKGIRHKADMHLMSGKDTVARESGELLFADYGLSGIGVMQLTAYAVRMKGEELRAVIDCVPSFSRQELSQALGRIISTNPSGKAENLLSGFMPKKLGEVILRQSGIIVSGSMGEIGADAVREIVRIAKGLSFTVTGVTGFEDAQVTAGGADTREFSPKTMESKKVRGLYCCGEILDVDGLCGGYNLAWAWSSGRLCGASVASGDKNDKNK